MKKEMTILLPNDVSLDLILVKPGYFIMGDKKGYDFTGEKHEHVVHISEPFYIGKYPVTQAHWQAVMGNNPSHFTGPQRPVENVSWKDIVEGKQGDNGKPAFLAELNNYLSVKSPDLAATDKFRLPTEAEWEYAAKGGPRYSQEELEDEKRVEYYSAYAGSDRLETCGWFDRNNGVETRPVGLKFPNELGLYDMSGNVLEWCEDWYDIDTYKNRKEPVSRDPVGPDSGGRRVLRGGSMGQRRGLPLHVPRRQRPGESARLSRDSVGVVPQFGLGHVRLAVAAPGEPAGRKGVGVG